MPSSAASPPSANLFKNYNRVIGLAYSLLIAALMVFFGYLLERKFQAEVSYIESDVSRHGQFFEFVLRSSADQLETFRMAASSAEQQMSGISPRDVLAQPPGAWLREKPHQIGFDLDAIPDPDTGGNLVGLGSLRDRTEDFYQDLATALSLNEGWSSMIFTLPNAAEAQFVSVHAFQAVLPWQDSTRIPFDQGVYASPLWQMGLPEANPDRTKFWAPVYFGDKERGLLAPVAAPIYDDNRFVGVLSIQTSIDYLNRINSDFNYPLGITFLVDQHRQVLAHPTLYAQPLDVTATPAMQSTLPEELVAEVDRLLELPSGRSQDVNGFLVIRYGLISAPWSLFYLVPKSSLWWQLLSGMGAIMVGVLLGLALLMGLTYALTSYEFVGPAAKLVEHIARESNFEPTTIPMVPSGWRPWFETITRAFHQSMQLSALRQELDIAAKMQQAILPRHWPEDPRFTLWGRMRPAKEIGGDFYDHFPVASGWRGLAVADVSGKGVPAGLFGMVSKTLLRSAATWEDMAIGDMLAKVNSSLAEDNDSCMFVTLFYARLDAETGRLEYVNAGHPTPLLIQADGSLRQLALTKGMALGVVGDIAYAASEVHLRPGDTLVMFSDGVTEAINKEFEEFGNARLAALFATKSPASPRQAVELVFNAVDEFANGVEQFDDITCVALRYLGPVVSPTAGAVGEMDTPEAIL